MLSPTTPSGFAELGARFGLCECDFLSHARRSLGARHAEHTRDLEVAQAAEVAALHHPAARRGTASADHGPPTGVGVSHRTAIRSSTAQAAKARPPTVPVAVSSTPAAVAAATPCGPRIRTAAAAPA